MRTARNIKIKSEHPISSQNSNKSPMVDGNEKNRAKRNLEDSPGFRSRIRFLVESAKEIPKRFESGLKVALSYLPFYVPGVLLIVMAVSLLVYPLAFTYVAALLVMYLGIYGVLIAKQLKKWRDTLMSSVRQIEARVYLKDSASLGVTKDSKHTEVVELGTPSKDTIFH